MIEVDPAGGWVDTEALVDYEALVEYAKFFAAAGKPLARGVAVVGALLVYEQSLVSADDLSQVKRAFDMNGYVGILYLLFLAVSVYVQ